MPHNRYTIQKDTFGTWSVIDIQTDLPASVRDKVLIAMPGQEAYDAAEMLNMIDSWRHEPAVDIATDLALGRGIASLAKAT